MKVLLLYLFIILSCYSVAQGFKSYYFVVWSSDRKLFWSDFKGNPPLYSKRDDLAAISSRVYIDDSSRNNDTIVISIVNVFDKFASWTKIKDTSQGKYALSHEQGHFDITEIYARKIRQSLSLLTNMKTFSPVDSVVKKYNDECEKEEDKYDEETNHGENLQEQGRWLFKIIEDLKELKEYKNTKFIIRIRQDK